MAVNRRSLHPKEITRISFNRGSYPRVNKLMLLWNSAGREGANEMATRHKPIFFRRKRRAPGVILTLIALTVVTSILVFKPFGDALTGLGQSLPSLYQWIPAAILWTVLLVMLSVAVFRGERD
jgi:hypothetical protein